MFANLPQTTSLYILSIGVVSLGMAYTGDQS
jgi:hypothetical protein